MKKELEEIKNAIQDISVSIESEKDPLVLRELVNKKKQLQYQALFYIKYLWNLEQ